MRTSVGSATLGLMAVPATLAHPSDTRQPRSVEDDARVSHLNDDEPTTNEGSIPSIRMVIKALLSALVSGVLVLGSAPASFACDNGVCAMSPALYDDPNNPKTPTQLWEMEHGS